MLRVVLFTAMLLNAAVAAEAQVIRGRLLDGRSDAPISAGAVMLRTEEAEVLSVLTDSVGRFWIVVPRPDRYMLVGSGFGYENATTPAIRVTENDTIDVEVRLVADALPLEAMTVTARPSMRARLLSDFEARREKGFGQFLGPEDVQRMAPYLVTDLLRDLRGIILRADRTRVDLMMRGLTGPCIPHLVVDGVGVADGISVNEFLSATSIRAIEVYSRTTEVPAEFASVIKRGCGVLVFWTESALGRQEPELLSMMPAFAPAGLVAS